VGRPWRGPSSPAKYAHLAVVLELLTKKHMERQITMKSKTANIFELYDSSPTIDEWAKDNVPDEDLIYRSGVAGQCARAKAVIEIMRLEHGNPDCCRVVSTHTSKSVTLPVIAFRKRIIPYNFDVIAIFRDNFHDLCCQVVSSHTMDMSLYDLYYPLSEEYMEEKRQGALEYRNKTSGYWKDKVKPKEEVVYEMQMETAGNWDWYEKYSGSKVFRADGKFFLIHRGWYEGFPCGGDYGDRKYYEGPTKDMSFLARGYPHMAHAIKCAFNAAEKVAIDEHYNK
jgi:hypothetical protein